MTDLSITWDELGPGGVNPDVDLPAGWRRWTIWNPVTDETYTFAQNPHAASGKRSRELTAQATVTGRPIYFQGEDGPATIDFEGRVRTRAAAEALAALVGVHHQVRLTDDLGRETWVLVTDFAPTRNQKARALEKRDYKMTGRVVDHP